MRRLARGLTRGLATASGSPLAPPYAAVVAALAPHGLSLSRSPSAGHSLSSLTSFRTGDVLLTEQEPLAWASDPATPPASMCAACFRALNPSTPKACACPGCGASYCSPACRARAWGGGHEVLCGGESALRAWAGSARGHNGARVAAAALSAALSRNDLVARWEAITRLAYATPPQIVPRIHAEGYAVMQTAFAQAGALRGDTTRFWDEVFPLRTYARLMATLRINAFAIVCPLGAAKDAVAAESAPQSAPLINLPPGLTGGGEGTGFVAVTNDVLGVPVVGTSSSGSAGDDADEGGCCSSEDAAAAAACGSGEAVADSPCGGSGSSTTQTASVGGGTALFALASFANHDCDPAADVVVAPGGALALRARRDISAGEDVTITYLDSSLGVVDRRKRLLAGYGFPCSCAMCTMQLRAATTLRARE